jgi:isopentenyl-diphosphate delta-isomerase
MTTEQRKKDHLKTCLEENVETPTNGFEDVILINKSLPEIDFDEIDTSTEFFGKKLNMPLMIDAITGGTEEARSINRDLASIAEKKKIIFELGSQRAMIENPQLKNTYYVRDVAPKTLIFGNLGIFQLKKFSLDQIKSTLREIGVDALAVHINPAQEVFQKEGDTDFSDLFLQLSNLCENLGYAVIGKEVGAGISLEVAQKLKEAGVKAIDVGGFGGTNWIVVDALRSGKDFNAFVGWGIPTSVSILESKVGLPIIATGGIRDGVEVAKAIALGADVCGMALPFLRILKKEGKIGIEKFIDKIQKELKTAMFLTGSKNIKELKRAKYVLTGKVRDWTEQRNLR